VQRPTRSTPPPKSLPQVRRPTRSRSCATSAPPVAGFLGRFGKARRCAVFAGIGCGPRE
jgi:hypothetical protein